MNGGRSGRETGPWKREAGLALVPLWTSHHLFDVFARAKGRISTSEDHNTDALVRLNLTKHGLNFDISLAVKRVSHLWPVHGYDSNPVGNVDRERFKT